MNKEEAIENVKKQLEGIKKANECGLATKGEFNKDIEAIETILNLIQTQQAEIEKKEKQIDLMAEQLAGLAIFDIEKDEPLVLGDKEEVKEYFTKKSEKEGIKDEQSR